MQFHFRQLRMADMPAIRTWRYDGPYARYNGTNLPLPPNVLLRLLYRWMGYECVAVEDEQGSLVGLFWFTRRPDRTVTIGLALRPDLTGKGYGLAFVEAGLAFGKQWFAPARFRLTVAAFNERAIKVYLRAGFHIVRKQPAQRAGSSYEMQRDA
ncbi:MAG TPA: GNAT family N-acetyltransferase [Ktedonobacterales bacterium]|jgi:ribosomal-protein-alanine N-acetyltransferase